MYKKMKKQATIQATKQVIIMLLIAIMYWTIMLLTNPEAQQNLQNARIYELMQTY